MSAVFDGERVHEFELLPGAAPHYYNDVDETELAAVPEEDRDHTRGEAVKVEPGSIYRSKTDLSGLFPNKFRYIGEVT